MDQRDYLKQKHELARRADAGDAWALAAMRAAPPIPPSALGRLHDEARAPAAVAQPVLDLVGPDQDASLGAGARGVGGACAGAVGPPELRARTPGVQRPHLGTVASGAL